MAKVWSLERNESISELDEKDVTSHAPTKSFRNDFLAYCDLFGAVPHPILLPRLHEDKNDQVSEAEPTTEIYDTSAIDEIVVRNWAMDSPSLRAMCLALPHCSDIIKLVLFNTSLTATQLQYLIKEIHNTSITTLSIEWNATDQDTSDIYAELFQEASPVQYLSLRSNNISPDGAKAIARRLPTLTKLVSLNLFGNKLGDDGALEFSRFLPGNSSLRQISFASNGLTGKSAIKLIESLTYSHVSEEIKAEIERSGDQVAQVIEQAKKEKRKLDKDGALMQLGLPILIEVDGTQYGKGNRTIEYLNLGSNAITKEDVIQMNTLLETHADVVAPYLQVVKLERTCKAIDDCTLSSLFQM